MSCFPCFGSKKEAVNPAKSEGGKDFRKDGQVSTGSHISRVSSG